MKLLSLFMMNKMLSPFDKFKQVTDSDFQNIAARVGSFRFYFHNLILNKCRFIPLETTN